MQDWGREVKFGIFLIPNATENPLAIAQRAEQVGFDYVGIQDHPYQRRFVDTWVLLSMIAASTSRIGLFPDVACLPLRPPAIMAKSAVSIDLLSGGRFDLGLGAGAFWDAIEAYGGKRRSPGQAIDALAESIEVIRRVWSGERNLRFQGEHYHLAGAQSGPVPENPIGIWLGVYGPRALGLTGRVADGWIPSLRDDFVSLAEMTERLDDAALASDRQPGEIRRILNIGGTITDGSSNGLFEGPVDHWVEQICHLVLNYGFDTFITSGDDDRHFERFANEVVPMVRQQVKAAR